MSGSRNRVLLSLSASDYATCQAYARKMGLPLATAINGVIQQFAPVMRSIAALPDGPMSAGLAREGIRQVLGAAVNEDLGAADSEAYAAYRQAAERLAVSEAMAQAKAWEVVEAARAVRAVVAPTTE